VSFAAIPLVLLLNECFCKRIFRYRLSPENFGYTLVDCISKGNLYAQMTGDTTILGLLFKHDLAISSFRINGL